MHKAVINGVELTEEQLKEGLAQIEQQKAALDPKQFRGGERVRSKNDSEEYIVFNPAYQIRVAKLWPQLDTTRSIYAFNVKSGLIGHLDLQKVERI